VDIAVLVIRVSLAAIFALAGVAKLADLRGSREAVAAFGVPERFARIAGLALPLAELTIAVLLLPSATSPVGLAGAALLLLVFSTAIGVSLARGEAPDCHCFGQLHSEPAGVRTLIRNAGLCVAAVIGLVLSIGDAGPSAVAWIGDLGALAAAAVVAAAVLTAAAAVAYVVRLTRGAATKGALKEGQVAPAFTLPSLEGPQVSLDELLRRGPPVVLVFTDSGCDDCKAIIPELGPVQREHDHTVTVVVVNAGDPEAIRGPATEHGLVDVLFDEDRSVQKAYRVEGAPSAIRVERPGHTTSLLVAGLDLSRAMVKTTSTGHQDPLGPPVGAPLPREITVLSKGRELPLVDLVEREALFLFWEHDCGSCREIRDELLARQAGLPEGVAELVIITTGDAKAVAREGFRAPVVVDPERRAAEALGVIGTPMAMLVDAHGRVGWPLAIGRSHILRLIRSRPRPAAPPARRRESPATLTRE
jgi:peroxiredoxin